MTSAEAEEAHTWRTRDIKKRLWPLKHQKDYCPALHTINTSPMLPHRRRELATGNNFTFSNPTSREGSNNSRNRSDEMEYDTWAERIKGQCNYFGKPSDAKLGAWTRRVQRKDNPDEDEFRWLSSSPDRSPVGSHGYYNDRDSRFSHISHSARAQTIAKYRQEMLDLVRGTPETAYELSLRDIVESPKITTPLQETVEDKSEEVKDDNENENEKKKKKKKKAGGILLKMFIPNISSVLGGRKSKGSSPSAKVSPKPMPGDGEESGSEKSADREWRSSDIGQMTSGSGGSSNSSNSSGRRRRRSSSSSSSRKLRGCCPFF